VHVHDIFKVCLLVPGTLAGTVQKMDLCLDLYRRVNLVSDHLCR
jgi:hypothetical protein